MKVVIIANNSNGLYLFRRHLISTLVERGHEVIALTPFDVDVENLRDIGAIMIETPIDRRGTNPIRDYSLIKLYKKELKKIKPDLVITYTIKPNVYGGIVCRHLKIPYAVNITGLGSAFERSKALRMIAIVLNKIALKRAKVVFFENTDNRDAFVRAGIIGKEKTCILHGAGVDVNYFSYQPYPNDQDFRFLFIGRVMKEKGVNELFEAMEQLRMDGINCTLDILGGMEEDYKEKISHYEKEGWLFYRGFQNDVRPFIARCHCFVLPSWHEGMANTNLESASSGRPVITTCIPGCMEAVKDGISGFLCEKQNSHDLYETMKLFLGLSYEKRKAMGLAGRNHMIDCFEKTKVVNETIRMLEV